MRIDTWIFKTPSAAALVKYTDSTACCPSTMTLGQEGRRGSSHQMSDGLLWKLMAEALSWDRNRKCNRRMCIPRFLVNRFHRMPPWPAAQISAFLWETQSSSGLN